MNNTVENRLLAANDTIKRLRHEILRLRIALAMSEPKSDITDKGMKLWKEEHVRAQTIVNCRRRKMDVRKGEGELDK